MLIWVIPIITINHHYHRHSHHCHHYLRRHNALMIFILPQQFANSLQQGCSRQCGVKIATSKPLISPCTNWRNGDILGPRQNPIPGPPLGDDSRAVLFALNDESAGDNDSKRKLSLAFEKPKLFNWYHDRPRTHVRGNIDTRFARGWEIKLEQIVDGTHSISA